MRSELLCWICFNRKTCGLSVQNYRYMRNGWRSTDRQCKASRWFLIIGYETYITSMCVRELKRGDCTMEMTGCAENVDTHVGRVEAMAENDFARTMVFIPGTTSDM